MWAMLLSSNKNKEKLKRISKVTVENAKETKKDRYCSLI
jgi:hypothetical protein